MGVDLNVTTAMTKCLAEALERYTLIYARANGVFLYKKSAKELKSMGYTCMYPHYDIYQDFVYKNHPYLKRMTPDLKVDWTAGKRFADNKQVWLPANYIHSYRQNIWSQILKKSVTSNGMSCSFFDSAVEDSILELIERDAFLYMWFSKSSGMEIIFDEVYYEPLKNLLYVIGSKMKQIKVIYKYTDIQIPCLFVILKGKKKYNEPAFLISGSADTDIERGCYRALSEFIAIYNSQSLHSQNKIKNMKDFKFKRFFDHTVYYSLYENFYKCKFFFDVSGRQKISELSKKWNIRKKQKILKKSLKGKDIFIADVTPREIEKTSLRIVRSYSPELFNLECGETIYNLSFIKKRVSKINKALKRKTVPLNTAPHCYP